MAKLSAKTKPEDANALATLTDAESERLSDLVKTLAEADPKQKAQVLRLRATRFENLATRIGDAVAIINDDKLANLHALIEQSKTAEQVAEIAAKQFKETPGLLPGTGGEAWKVLFEAARTFAAESHAGRDFPHLGPEATCPLCQNALGVEAAGRLIAFDSFVQQEAEQTAKTARATAVSAYQVINQATSDLAIDEPLRGELEELSPNIAEACVAMQSSLTQRQAAIRQAAGNKAPWEDIPTLPFAPRAALDEAKSKLMANAKTLEESADEKARAAMTQELAELQARQRLSELKALVFEAIDKMALAEKLTKCRDACATTGISRKCTELARTMATPEVAAALNEELQALNVHELQVAMRNVSPGGKTQFKLTLELPGGGKPSAILSEGEQRAIAIASFLAEINLGSSHGGVVFDDPVSSLDHRRRWHVARRLAQEATKRQVIIFTHDIYFLCILQQEADKAGLSLSTQCIRKSVDGFGSQTDRLPFDALSTSKRVKALRSMHEQVAKAHKAGDEDHAKMLTRNAYYHLRLAWERAVEEVLLQGVVSRFDEGISTKKLRYVVVEDNDYKIIDEGMTKSSKFAAHDPAANAMLPTPHPDELCADIEKLENWRRSVEDRKKLVEERRN